MGTTWLDDLWDTGTKAFDKYIDFDSYKFEKQMAQDQYRWETSQARDDAPSQSSWSPVDTSSGGIDGKTLLIGAAVIGGGYLAAKQFKLI